MNVLFIKRNLSKESQKKNQRGREIKEGTEEKKCKCGKERKIKGLEFSYCPRLK